MKEFKYTINENTYDVKIDGLVDDIANVEVNGVCYQVKVEKTVEVEKPRPVVKPAAASAKPSALKSGVKAPLPGVILEIKVNVGDTVKKGDTVLILEAMKMENNICAEKDGTVTAIQVEAGESVMEGTLLVTVE